LFGALQLVTWVLRLIHGLSTLLSEHPARKSGNHKTSKTAKQTVVEQNVRPTTPGQTCCTSMAQPARSKNLQQPAQEICLFARPCTPALEVLSVSDLAAMELPAKHRQKYTSADDGIDSSNRPLQSKVAPFSIRLLDAHAGLKRAARMSGAQAWPASSFAGSPPSPTCSLDLLPSSRTPGRRARGQSAGGPDDACCPWR